MVNPGSGGEYLEAEMDFLNNSVENEEYFVEFIDGSTVDGILNE